MADRTEAHESAGTPPVVDDTVPPGSDEHADAVWGLKERIRRQEGLLNQRRPFFTAQYRQSTCYLAVAVGGDPAVEGGAGDVVGFALVRPDGYLSLLGVAPDHRRRGLGSRLLDRVTDDHPEVTCHVRATNADAIGFYVTHGFLVEGHARGYYRNGTDAYRMARDPEGADGLADLLE